MRKQIKVQALLLAAVLLAGAALYGFLYQADNKYTSALPGGYGYNVLPADLEQVSFLVDGWEYYPGQLLSPSDFEGGSKTEQYTYIGEHANFSDSLGRPTELQPTVSHWKTQANRQNWPFISRSCCVRGGSTSTEFWLESRAAWSHMLPGSWMEYMPWQWMEAQKSSYNVQTIPTTTPACTILRQWGPWEPSPEC